SWSGRPLFYEVMRRKGPFCFYAFDLLCLDESDLRDRPLLMRKAQLRKLLWNGRYGDYGRQKESNPRVLKRDDDAGETARSARAILYVDHVSSGTDLFRVICDRDIEGIVAKQASAAYTPEATTWVKIKNKHYSQA